MNTATLTLGTAKIEETAGFVTVQFMRTGSFSVGQQMFGNWNAALNFCYQRGLRVIGC